MSIGERIRVLRKRQNISQLQLAKVLDVSRQAVSKWENDLSTPDMLNLIRLADILDTDTEFLATGKHAESKEAPSVVTVVQKVDSIVEKIVEKPVEVEKIVEVERVVEKIVEIPVVKKVFRLRYLRNPVEFVLVGLGGVLLGFFIGLLF